VRLGWRADERGWDQEQGAVLALWGVRGEVESVDGGKLSKKLQYDFADKAWQSVTGCDNTISYVPVKIKQIGSHPYARWSTGTGSNPIRVTDRRGSNWTKGM
jgi:hypothetical protein